MKWKTWAPAILAVVLGGIAAKVAHDSMRAHPAPVTETPKTARMVVAGSDMQTGQDIRPENVEVAMIAGIPPADGFVNPTDLVGRVLTQPIAKGQPIVQTNLAPRGATGSLPSLVPPGMRAVTIPVDESNSLSGMLLPGCRVDVVGTLASGRESTSRTLISNVLVQAVGQRLTSAKPEDGKEPPPYHTVTLIVSPHDGQLIDLASTSARMRLMLRGLVKGDESTVAVATMDEIRGPENKPTVVVLPSPATQPSVQVQPVQYITPAPRVQPVQYITPAPAKWDIEVITGTSVSHVLVEAPHMPDTVDVKLDTSLITPDAPRSGEEKPEQ